MSTTETSTQSEHKVKRHRPDKSQRFPSISLPKAIERAQELYGTANDREVHVVAAGKSWGYSEKSSATGMTVSALKSFGLLEDSGSKKSRTVQLTDMALRIIRDPRAISPDRDALLRQAALTPPIHKEIIEKYNGLPPSDVALKTHLLLDRGFKEDAVHDFLKEFEATMSHAKISSDSNISDFDSKNVGANVDDGISEGADVLDINVGDYIQWTSGGQDQFNPARRVTSISDDRQYIQVEGSNTGIPVTEVSKSTPPINNAVNNTTAPPQTHNVITETSTGFDDLEENDIKVLLDGGRLRVSAYVDKKGLRRLKKMLGKYEEILNMLSVDDDEIDD